MSCSRVMDIYYDENHISLFSQIRISLHTLFCADCAQKIEQYENAKEIMREDFIPALPWISLEEPIMSRLHDDQISIEDNYSETPYSIPGVPSTRGWVIAGIVLVVSLITAFFGFDFQSLASESGISFTLPMGITIGIILTTYGALFIGSHLKELSERFGL